MSIVRGLAITFFLQMPVDIVQWRDEIGAFDNGKKIYTSTKDLFFA